MLEAFQRIHGNGIGTAERSEGLACQLPAREAAVHIQASCMQQWKLLEPSLGNKLALPALRSSETGPIPRISVLAYQAVGKSLQFPGDI